MQSDFQGLLVQVCEYRLGESSNPGCNRDGQAMDRRRDACAGDAHSGDRWDGLAGLGARRPPVKSAWQLKSFSMRGSFPPFEPAASAGRDVAPGMSQAATMSVAKASHGPGRGFAARQRRSGLACWPSPASPPVRPPRPEIFDLPVRSAPLSGSVTASTYELIPIGWPTQGSAGPVAGENRGRVRDGPLQTGRVDRQSGAGAANSPTVPPRIRTQRSVA